MRLLLPFTIFPLKVIPPRRRILEEKSRPFPLIVLRNVTCTQCKFCRRIKSGRLENVECGEGGKGKKADRFSRGERWKTRKNYVIRRARGTRQRSRDGCARVRGLPSRTAKYPKRPSSWVQVKHTDILLLYRGPNHRENQILIFSMDLWAGQTVKGQ